MVDLWLKGNHLLEDWLSLVSLLLEKKKKNSNNNKNLHHLSSLFSKVQYLPKVIWKQSCTHQMQRSSKKSWLLKLRRSEQENM